MRSPIVLSVSRYRRFCRLHLRYLRHPDRSAGVASPPLQRAFALAMALLLLPIWQEVLWAQQSTPQDADTNASQAYGQQVQRLSAEQMQQLVAPIALYPDSLIALMLTASAYPAQIVDADGWLQARQNASPNQIAAGADAQSWDSSVKALTAFPQVLGQMARNLPWTTDLGNAYYNQRADTLEAVQVLRSEAQRAGNLQTTAQEAVNYVSGNIELVPVNPQVVYVPIYNPWTVYGQPISPYPGFSLFGALGSFLNSSAVHWGLGIAMTAFSHMPWGWLAWGLSWLAQSVLFNNSTYDSSAPAVASGGSSYGGAAPSYSGGGYGDPGGGYGYSGFGGYNQGFGQGTRSHPTNGIGYSGSRYGANRAQGYVVHRPPASAVTNVPRPSGSYNRPGSYRAGEYNASTAHNNVPRPPSFSSGYRSPESASRGYWDRSYTGASRQSYPSSVVHRPPGSDGFYSARVQRPSFGPYSSANFGHSSYTGSSFKQSHATSFHPFGGGHGSQSLYASKASFHAPKETFHAPKMKAPKNYGGHSGGGHFGGHSGGGHHH